MSDSALLDIRRALRALGCAGRASVAPPGNSGTLRTVGPFGRTELSAFRIHGHLTHLMERRRPPRGR